VPLSDNEQRLLQQMEQALADEDPKFATTLRGKDVRVVYRRRAVVAAFGFLAGVSMLLGGAILGSSTSVFYLLALLGFAVMLTSAFYALSSWRRIPAPGELANFSTGSQPSAGPKQSGPSFMTRVEDRWKRRRGDMGR
jgi:hypothetical protein